MALKRVVVFFKLSIHRSSGKCFYRLKLLLLLSSSAELKVLLAISLALLTSQYSLATFPLVIIIKLTRNIMVRKYSG